MYGSTGTAIASCWRMPQDDLVDRDAMIDDSLAKPGAWRDQPWDDEDLPKEPRT